MHDPIEAYCDLYGSALDVPELEKQLDAPLASKTILGQIEERGHYKGEPSPYGSCNIVVPSNVEIEFKVEWLADCIAHNIDLIRKLGVEDIEFWIVWRGIQGNMELSAKELQKIAALNIPLCMNYYYVSPEEDE